MPFKWNFVASERTIVGLLWESHIKRREKETCFAGNPKHTNGIQMERASLSIITQVSIWSWPIAPCVHHKQGTKLDRSHNDQQSCLHDNYVRLIYLFFNPSCEPAFDETDWVQWNKDNELTTCLCICSVFTGCVQKEHHQCSPIHIQMSQFDN